jgi:hypothetical protein
VLAAGAIDVESAAGEADADADADAADAAGGAGGAGGAEGGGGGGDAEADELVLTRAAANISAGAVVVAAAEPSLTMRGAVVVVCAEAVEGDEGGEWPTSALIAPVCTGAKRTFRR